MELQREEQRDGEPAVGDVLPCRELMLQIRN
jgi:hypothetical protein